MILKLREDIPPPHEINMRWINDVLMAWCNHGWVAKVRPWKAPNQTAVLSPGTDDHAELIICYRYAYAHEVPRYVERMAYANDLLPAMPEDVPPYTPIIVPDTLRPWFKLLLSL
jgi:hypothetical protein